MDKVVEAEALCKDFQGNQVLKGISLSVQKGEFLAIMGQSGSGKSTLLYNISGMDDATSGKVVFEGESLIDMTEEALSKMRLQKMGFIFQHSYLLKSLSIQDNIVLPGFTLGRNSREQIKKEANVLMEKMGILNVAGHDITEVSGGQLQRAAVCRALINHPSVLFGDEPTGALNRSATKEVMDIINGVNNEGTTVMLVTHDAKVAARAERVIFLVDGKIQSEMSIGKYDEKKENLEAREEELSKWLLEQGF